MDYDWSGATVEEPQELDWEGATVSSPGDSGYTSGISTTFGYNDPQDNGIGAWGDRTNNPGIIGVSLPIAELRRHFGDENKAHNTLVEVRNPETGRVIQAPIVDKGPADWVIARQGPTIDLTEGARRELGAGGKSKMEWRLLSYKPSDPAWAGASVSSPQDDEWEGAQVTQPEQGNIDLSSRPQVKNPDGSISTVRSISIEEDGREVLIPTVVGGKVVSNEEAIKHYHQTGENLGKFASREEADTAAEGIHESEAAKLKPKREVGAIESAYRAGKSSMLGLSEFVSRHGISPLLHGARQAIEGLSISEEDKDRLPVSGGGHHLPGPTGGHYLLPTTREEKSILKDLAKTIDESFFKRFVQDVAKQREDLAFDPKTEARTLAGQKGKVADFAGEAAEVVGGIVPDIGAAVVTGGASPATSGLVAGLQRGAGIFTLPAARNGMDAANRVKKEGGSPVDQAKAFLGTMLETQAMAAVPMNVESKLATLPGRVASRAAQGGALGVATGEAFRQGENLLGNERDFELTRAAIDAIVPGILGGAFGRNAKQSERYFSDRLKLEDTTAPEKAKGGESAKPQTTTPDAEYFRGVSKEELELTRQTGKLQASKGIYKAKPGQTMVSPVREEAEQFAKKYGGGVIELDKNLNILNTYEPGKGAALETAKGAGKSIPTTEEIADYVKQAAPGAHFVPAIRVQGEVFSGKSHYDAVSQALQKHSRKDVSAAESGSINDAGEFVPFSEGVSKLSERASGINEIKEEYPTLGIVASPKAVEGVEMLGKALQGGKKPSGKPSILPMYRGDLFRTYEGTADILEKSGFTELGGKLREYVDNRRKHSGHLDNQFRLWGKGLSSNQVKASEGEFRQYHEAADSGDMAEAAGVYKAASQKAQEAIDTWDRVRKEAAALARKAGFQVFDGKQWKPFHARENFFPRRIKPEWRKVLRNPEKHPEQYEALKREAIARGMVKNGAEFDARVDSALEKSGPNNIATVERSRTAELPTQVYDYGFETVRNYIAAFSDAIAKTEAFGQAKGGKLSPALDRAQKLARDDYSKNYINRVNKYINPEINPDAWVAQLARGISTGSFLGNPRSSIRNLVSGAMFNLQHHGLREGLRSIMAAGRAFKDIENAYEKGILHADLANMMTNDATNAGQMVNKATNKVLTWAGYKAVEEWTRGLALRGAMVRLRAAIRESQENPLSKAAINNSAYFKRLGIDPIALLDEAGEGPLTDRFLRSSVAEIQGGYMIDQTPLLLQSEAGKTIFHLQKWGTQALRHFDRNVVNPALQAIKLGRKEFVSIRDKNGNIVEARVPGSVRALARYVLLAAAFGMGQQQAEEWIFGIPDKEASFAEILMRMDDDALGAFGMFAHKLYSASLSVGALGALGGYAKTLEVVGLDNALTPPPIQILATSKDFITKWMDQGKITANNVRDAISAQFSGIRTTGQMLARTNVFGKEFPYLEMIRKKQDLTWMRAAVRRFEDDIGYKRKPFGGDKRANPMTPFYSDIEEKLLLGDVVGARKAVRDHFKGMPPAKVKLGMEGLKKSVLGNRPIRAGGSGGEARRANFLQWTGKNLPKADQLRIKQIDDTYRNAAIRVGLMDPKPVSLKDMQEDMRKLKLRNELLSGD